MKKFFKNEEWNDRLINDGFFHLNLFQERTISDLKEFAKKQDIADRNTYNLESSPKPFSEDKNVLIRQRIIETVMGELEKVLNNYKIVRAYFIPKAAFNKSFIPPHQDPSITPETDGVNETVLCWFPLNRTTLKNGTMGFLKGSHSASTAPSPATPDPRTPRFQDANVFELYPFLEFIDFNIGDAVFFSNRTFHGSLPNYGDDERLAIRLDLVPKSATLVNHFLKPESDKKKQLCYEVDDAFFTKFTNERLIDVYDAKEDYPDYKLLEEKEYYLDSSSLKEFVEKINAAGHNISSKSRIQDLVEHGYEKKSFILSVKNFFKNIFIK